MDLIYECANNFMNLVNTKYHFVFVQNRKRHDIVLDFQPSDFRHATGLHHITDIAIEKNPMKLINAILYTVPSKISDRKLEKSKKYKAVSPYSGSVCRFGNAIKYRKRRVPAVQSTDSANETVVELLIVLIAVLLALYRFVVGSTCGVG